MKSIKVGVCGVGNVGGAVLETLTSSPEIIENNGGVKINIIQVGARKGKSAVPFDLNVTTDLMDVANNPEVGRNDNELDTDRVAVLTPSDARTRKVCDPAVLADVDAVRLNTPVVWFMETALNCGGKLLEL